MKISLDLPVEDPVLERAIGTAFLEAKEDAARSTTLEQSALAAMKLAAVFSIAEGIEHEYAVDQAERESELQETLANA